MFKKLLSCIITSFYNYEVTIVRINSNETFVTYLSDNDE